MGRRRARSRLHPAFTGCVAAQQRQLSQGALAENKAACLAPQAKSAVQRSGRGRSAKGKGGKKAGAGAGKKAANGEKAAGGPKKAPTKKEGAGGGKAAAGSAHAARHSSRIATRRHRQEAGTSEAVSAWDCDGSELGYCYVAASQRRHALIAGCTHNLQDTPLFAGGQRGEGWALQACHTNHTLLALHRSGGRRGESWLPQALKARAVWQIGM